MFLGQLGVSAAVTRVPELPRRRTREGRGLGILVLLAPWLLAGSEWGPDLEARAGEPPTATFPAAVAEPSSPALVESRAADELSRYLGLITGQAVPVYGEQQTRPPGRALQVGGTLDNLSQHSPDSWLPDTIYIGYGPGTNDIAIIGEGTQGTLFAAYEFLRDLGCRWYLPDYIYPDGEFVPSNPSPTLPTVAKSHSPSFRERGWNPAPASLGVWQAHLIDWAVRNGLNALRPTTVFDYGAARGHGLRYRGGHTLPVHIPSGDFPGTAETFAAHPTTLSNMRSQYYAPHVMRRLTRSQWEAAGRPDAVKEAQAAADRLVETHEYEPPQDVLRELRQIYERARTDLG